jgi:1-phosphatidylinositol-4-phosphate 5-kinase
MFEWFSSESDFDVLMEVGESYADYVSACRQRTLLPKYLGLFTLSLTGQEPITFVVMNNVFAGYLDIHKRFDLKGSTAGRKASARERQKKHIVFKDLDLKDSGTLLPLGDDILGVIRGDAAWLAKAGLMDYSLLLGIHSKAFSDKKPSTEGSSGGGGSGSATAPFLLAQESVSEEQVSLYDEFHDSHYAKAHRGVVYMENKEMVAYIGIVDILTRYGAKKRAETLFTGTLICRDVSCQPPKRYARRFVRFFEQMIVADTNAHVSGFS